MLNHQIRQQQDTFAEKAGGVTDAHCDFDGTITRVDATDAVLEAFALPAWREWEQRWVNGNGANGAGASTTEAASNGYPMFPLRTLTEINRLIMAVRSCLGKVTAPTIILQAREDDLTSPKNAQIVYDEIASTEKHLTLLDNCYHVITVDKQRQTVVKELVEFFDRQAAHKQS